ncbi:hypothetical protein E2C01_093626 [Portunus trituberculatus]|uniref:Uncharacterized protein n=1 Tax=Portunus trituberculatus TaxID=210409 RepID=A0A5B7JUP3_PORTR|nr:hypothetical protein [Portunus trituberculatus]
MNLSNLLLKLPTIKTLKRSLSLKRPPDTEHHHHTDQDHHNHQKDLCPHLSATDSHLYSNHLITNTLAHSHNIGDSCWDTDYLIF